MAVLTLAGCGGSGGFNENSVLKSGLSAQAAGRLADADSYYLSVVKHDPHNKLAWYNLGVIAQQHEEATASQHDYLQALAADPKYVPALYNLALVETQFSPKTAIGLYQQVTQLQPGDAAAHYNLGVLLVKQGQATQGQQEIGTALKLDPALAKQ